MRVRIVGGVKHSLAHSNERGDDQHEHDEPNQRGERPSVTLAMARARGSHRGETPLTRVTARLPLELSTCRAHRSLPGDGSRRLDGAAATRSRPKRRPLSGRPIDYLERCQAIAHAAGVSIRELDEALWQDSRESDVRAEGEKRVPSKG